MSKIKKIISGILVLSLILLTPGVNTFAATNSSEKVISFEEYYSTLTAEYAKYGITYEVLERNYDIVLNEEMLQRQLELAKQEGEKLKAENLQAEMKAIKIQPQVNNNDLIAYPDSMMPITYTAYQKTTVTSPMYYGNAEIATEVSITENIDTGTFLAVNIIRSRQLGGSINFDSWTQTSARVENYGYMAYTFVTGTLAISYTDPITGSKIGYTSDHSITEVFVPKYQ